MIRFSCPGCSATYTVGDEKAGKTGKCPKCQSQFVIPMPEGGSAPSPTPSAPELPPLPPPIPAPAPEPAAGPVEIAPCPSCQTRLTVEVQDLGSDVQCPTCNTVFKAVRPGAVPPVPPPAPAKKSNLEDAGRREARQDEDDDKPKKGSRWAKDDDEDDDKPKKKRRDDDEEEDEKPRKSSRRDDDDEDDDRPKKKKRKGGRGEPHRGTMILILGILGFACCGIFTGIPAYLMGKTDLAKMDAGQMDEEGRQMTNIGRILGMVTIILTCVGFLLGCCSGIAQVATGGLK